MIDLNDIKQLNDELSGAVTNLAPLHVAMELHCQYYENSAFFPRKAGDKPNQNYLFDNYLQVFADKNIEYTSKLPLIKVDASPADRELADVREKILYAVHRLSGTREMQKNFSRDATLKSMAVAQTYMNHKTGQMEVKRYDPRYCYWKLSEGNEKRLTAFWAVFPITKTEAQKKYGVTPTVDTVSFAVQAKQDPYFHSMDGQDWFTMAIRLDETTRVAWIGDKIIEEAHDHLMGVIPVDMCAPFISDKPGQLGSFYLSRLISLQAELNDTIRRRSNIVKRMSHPILWGRNIKANTYDDVKSALRDAETGVLGLGKDGEVGILQLQEIKTLYEHESAIKNDMQRLSGFASASFGESVGANTSGDALGMYFTPTQQHVEVQQISWQSFWESVNYKILRGYDVFGRGGNTFRLSGYHPRSTIQTAKDGQQTQLMGAGNYDIEFDHTVINGNYNNRVVMPPIIPKNEIEEKRLVKESVESKFISRHTGYEMWGIESPEDEKRLLLLEQADPLLNPDGTSKILSASSPAPQERVKIQGS